MKTMMFLFMLSSVYCQYGEWYPSTRSGMGIDNFAGGTRGPNYQYEQTYTRSTGLFTTQTAKASDFYTIAREHLHLDPSRDDNRDPERGMNRDPESGMNRDPDQNN